MIPLGKSRGDFVTAVGRWIEERGEVLVVLRYLRAGGSKNLAICRSLENLSRPM